MPGPPIPYDPDAEQIILGNCLLQESAAPLGPLNEADFFSANNRKVFEALRSLAEAGEPINLLSVARYLHDHGNSVPASYVSGLIDGVPILAKLEREQARIQNLTQERAVLREAASLAQEGLTVEEITERAAALAETAKPKKAAGVAAQKYPQIPKEAWAGPAWLYHNAVENSTEGSDNWHFICFYTVVGALLGRNVFTRMGRKIYGHLFSVLVGLVGGDGKDTCMDYALDFAQSVDNHLYLPETIDSKEGFAVNWSNFQTRLMQQKVLFPPRAIVRLPELRSLLDKAEQKGTKNIIPMLNSLYDSRPKLSNESVSSPACVEEPHASFLVGTASRWMKNMSEVDLMSGFGRRLIFVPGDPKPPVAEPDPPDEEILAPLSYSVKEIVEYWRDKPLKALELSGAARKLWSSWYKTYKSRIVQDDLIGAMSIGDRTTCRKIALINAAMDRAERIEEWHLERAVCFTEFLFESRWPVFSEHGASPNREVESKLVALVKKAGGRIGKRNLQQSLRIDAETFHRRLRFLCEPDGLLKMERMGKRWWVSLAD